MSDRTDFDLPWFVSLLGHPPSHAHFSKMCADYALTHDSPGDAPGWYENADRGVSVYIHAGRIDTIQFFHQPHSRFGGPLTPSFLGVDYSMKRDDIRRRFGEPDEVIGERAAGAIRHAGIDRYFLQGTSIAFGYSILSGHVDKISFEWRTTNK